MLAGHKNILTVTPKRVAVYKGRTDSKRFGLFYYTGGPMNGYHFAYGYWFGCEPDDLPVDYEESDADARRDFALQSAYDDGDADECCGCNRLFWNDELVETENGLVYCENCAPEDDDENNI